MWRTHLCDGCAMGFPWKDAQPELSFWMEHTPVKIDIVYVAADDTVVSVKPLNPQDTTAVRSGAPAQLAVELPRGFAAAHGIGPGSKVHWKDQLPASAFVCDHCL